MHEPFMKAGSRGSSILGSILLLALAGGTAVTIEPWTAFEPVPPQLAASMLAVTEPVTDPATRAEKDDLIVKDDIPSQTVTAAVPPYTVFYSCTQRGEVSEVKQLTQNCKPGFNYTVRVNAGKVIVIPTPSDAGSTCPANAPDAAKKCSDSISPTPTKSCTSYAQRQPCKIFYCADVKCELGGEALSGGELGIEENLLTGLGNVIKNAGSDEERIELLQKTGIGGSAQSILFDAFKTEEKIRVLDAEKRDVAEQIESFAGCTSHACAEQVSMLRLDDAKLASQQHELQTQLAGLQNNAQRLLAGSQQGRFVPSSADRLPSQLDFARAGQSTFTAGGDGSVASEKRGGIFSGIMDYAYSAGALALKLPGTVAETAARWTPRVIEGGRAGAEVVRTIVTGLPEGVKVVGGNVTTVAPKAASKVGEALPGPAAGATVAITGAVELGVGVGNVAGEYFFGPIDEESRRADGLARLDELLRVNIALPGSESPRTVQELGQQIGLIPSIAAEPQRGTGGLLGFGSQPVAQAPRVSELPGQQATDRGFVPTNITGGIPSIFRMPPTSGRLGIEDRHFVPALSLFPGTAAGVTYLDVPGGTTDRGFAPTIISRGIETSPASVPVESASPRFFGPLPFQPLASQNQAGFGGEINFSNAYTPQGVASLLLTPITGADRTVSPLGTRSAVIAPVAPDARAVAVTGNTVVPVPFSRVNPVPDNVIVPAFSNTRSVQPVPDERAPIVSSLFIRYGLTGGHATPVSDTSVRAAPVDTVVPVLSTDVSAAPFTPLRPQNVYTEPSIVLTDRAVAVRADAAAPAVSNTRTMGVADSIAVPIPFSRASPLSNNVIIPAFPGAFPAQPISDERISPVGVSPERLPLGSQNQAGFGDAIDFGQGGSQTGVRTSLVPQIRGPILTMPDIETEEQSDTGGTGGTGNPPNPPGSNEPPNPSNTGIGWKWPIIGTGVGAGTCWLWWCNSTETPPPPVKTPPPRSTNEDSKAPTEQPDASSPAETGTKKPDVLPPEQPQYEPRVPNTGITYPEDHYCVTNVQPLTVYIIPKGTPFPTNCYNNPYQTTPYPNYQPPGYVEAPARPYGPSNVGQSLGQALQRFITGDAQSEREETPIEAPPPVSATSTPTTTPQLVPALLLVANPASVAAGQHTKLSWASVFTRTCSITDATETPLVESGEPSGSVIVPALSETTTFTAVCTTNATSTVSATTAVEVR